MQDSTIYENLGARPKSMEAQEIWFDKYKNEKDKIVYAVEFRGKHIGNVSLFNIKSIEKTAFLSIFIGDNQNRGKGLGKKIMAALERKAVVDYRLQQLKLEVVPTNLAAIKCYENCGYSHFPTSGDKLLMVKDL